MLKEIDFLITNECDNYCRFCSFNSGKKLENELTTEEVFDIIDQAEQLKVEDIHFTGGEPTLRKDLLTILEYARNNFSGGVRLISNGNNLSYDYLLALKERGLKSIMISVDGDEETHDYLRAHKGSYANVIKAAKTAVELGFTTRLSLVANKLNMNVIKGEIEKAVSLGVEIFSIFILSPVGRGIYMQDKLFSPEEWIKFCSDLKKWYDESDFKDKMILIVEKGFQKRDEVIDLKKIHGRGVGCTSIGSNREYLMINSVGNMYPCVFFVTTNHSLGNIRDLRLKNVVDCDSNWIFYKKLETKKYEGCEKCNDYEICRGGCKGFREINSDIKICNDQYYQVCPIMKVNFQTSKLGGSSEEALGD